MDRTTERAVEWDCSQLMLRFYDAFDAWDYAGMAALFAPDGVWQRAGKTLAGREAIVAELQQRPTTQVVRHVLSNLLVTAANADQAQARFYITVYRHDGGTARSIPAPLQAPAMLLVVNARLVRHSEGWRILHQAMAREFEARP